MTEHNDEWIVKNAIRVDPKDAQVPQVYRLMAMLTEGLRAGGHDVGMHMVYWPTGAAAMVFGDPSDVRSWKALLVKTYREAEVGALGPLPQ